VYKRQLSDSSEANIGDSDYSASRPRVSSDYIVWLETKFGSDDRIWFRRISSSYKQAFYGSAEFDLSKPDIFGTLLIYVKEYEEYSQVAISNLSRSVGLIIETSNEGEYNPTVHEDRIFWHDYGKGEFRSKNFETGDINTVYSSSGRMFYPRVWGDRMIYRSDRYDPGDIFLVELDQDHDGVLDSEDLFPDNPDEAFDMDGDRMGDNADPDADGDGIPDINDEFYLDPAEWSDFDGDGIGDNSDKDDDNDGILDGVDSEPFNPLNAIGEDISLILVRIAEMGSDISDEKEDLKNDIMITYSGLNSTLQDRMETDLNIIMEKMGELMENLTSMNFPDESISENLSSILENLTGMDEGIEDRFDQLQLAAVSAIQILEEVLEGLPLNDSSNLDSVEAYLQQMMALLDIIDDIEDLNSEMSSQKEAIESTEDTSRNMSIIVIVLLAVLILISIISLFLNRARKPEDDYLE
jgi:hypothetical protein